MRTSINSVELNTPPAGQPLRATLQATHARRIKIIGLVATMFNDNGSATPATLTIQRNRVTVTVVHIPEVNPAETIEFSFAEGFSTNVTALVDQLSGPQGFDFGLPYMWLDGDITLTLTFTTMAASSEITSATLTYEQDD